MNLFNRKETTMEEPAITGVSILREIARIRVKTKSYGALANDLGVTGDRFIAFSEGRAELPIDVLQQFALDHFGKNATLDEATLMLKSTNTKPAMQFVQPESFDPRSSPTYVAVAPGAHLLPQGKHPPQAKPKRAGWLGGLW